MRLLILLALWSAAAASSRTAKDRTAQENQPSPRRFYIANDVFMTTTGTRADGAGRGGPDRQVSLYSGDLHYSRVVPALWRDRLLRLQAMGLNAVTTYVPWNFHETVQGEFDFASPDRDLAAFIRLVGDLGMHVVLRPGPYICGEWEFGGFPAWLFANGSIPLRTFAEPYIGFVDIYWKHVLDLVKAEGLLFEDGGPVVMVQIENEYGSYGDVSKNPSDLKYIQHLVALARQALGENALLFTTDFGDAGHFAKGSLNGSAVYTVGDGCTDPEATWAAQKSFNPSGMSPFFCSEFYPGWYSHWTLPLANTSSATVASALQQQVDCADGTGSVSLYMAHGGTSFGWWAGANSDGGDGGSDYVADITSYDYNAAVAESGEHGFGSDGRDKFEALRAVFAPNRTVFPPEPPLPPRHVGGAAVAYAASLFANLDRLSPSSGGRPTATNLSEPVAVEGLGPQCYYGFVVYEADAVFPTTSTSTGTDGSAGEDFELSIPDVRDRAMVWVDGAYVGTTFRATPTNMSFSFPAPRVPGGSVRLRILVENTGRINFDHGMDDDRKGIVKNVLLNGGVLATTAAGWTAQCLELNEMTFKAVRWEPVGAGAKSLQASQAGPMLYKSAFTMSEQADLFFWDAGLGKGAAWLNGFHAGRFWEEAGPQHTLYLPAPKTIAGSNELVLLCLNATTPTEFSFVDSRKWGL